MINALASSRIPDPSDRIPDPLGGHGQRQRFPVPFSAGGQRIGRRPGHGNVGPVHGHPSTAPIYHRRLNVQQT